MRSSQFPAAILALLLLPSCASAPLSERQQLQGEEDRKLYMHCEHEFWRKGITRVSTTSSSMHVSEICHQWVRARRRAIQPTGGFE